ncbi:hypothetical protein BDZ91DRAFT_797612 [Kalaharituber pfeilii]|nr:hypothetical protein BDZ91DRAFT_797612 [Kalaharituber pfeilii]
MAETPEQRVLPQDNQPSTAQASLPVQSEVPLAPPQALSVNEPWVIYNHGALTICISPWSILYECDITDETIQQVRRFALEASYVRIRQAVGEQVRNIDVRAAPHDTTWSAHEQRYIADNYHITARVNDQPNFRIQFQTASGTSTSRNPKRINSAQGPTGAEVAETELAKRQAIQERNDIADNHTQDVIVTVLHSYRKVDEALELAEEIPEYDNVDNYTQDVIVLHSRRKMDEALELAEEIPEYDDVDNYTQDVMVLHSCRKMDEALELAEEIP